MDDAGAAGPDEESTLAKELWGRSTGLIGTRESECGGLDETCPSGRRDVTSTVNEDAASHDETTVIEHVKNPAVIVPTDRNSPTLVSRET